VSERIAVDRSSDPALRFDPLFEAHHQAIYRYCVRRVGRADAEDATAEVFAVAWRRLNDMPQGEPARAWLYGVAYRVIGNHYRASLRRRRLTMRLQSREDEPGADDADPEVEALLTALEALSPADQELVRLSAWDGLSRSEIATVLGIKENAVDQRLHRARARLRDRLGDHAIERPQETKS
jgi:RNA polymerase sigma-70 factor (ECF subfamily)